MNNSKMLLYSLLITVGCYTNASACGGGEGTNSITNVKQGPANVRGFTAEEIDFFLNQVSAGMLTEKEMAEYMRNELNERFGHNTAQANETKRLNAEAYVANFTYQVVEGGVLVVSAAGAIVAFIATAPQVAAIGTITLIGDLTGSALGSLAEDYGTNRTYGERFVKASYGVAAKAFWSRVGDDFVDSKQLSNTWGSFAKWALAQVYDRNSLQDLTEERVQDDK